MARILIPANGGWYDELRAVSYYSESDLERWIHHHAKSLFPHHFVFPFKKEVVSRMTADTKRPDLVLIRRDFSAWVVVEVEVEKHALKHVLDQTRVFLQGDYNAHEVAEYARDRLRKCCGKAASLKRLTQMFSEHAPSVMVITDMHKSDWERELKNIGIDFCVFEVYKNASGHYVYRTFGHYPAVDVDEAQCRRHAQIANLVEVIGNFTFTKLPKGKRVEVVYDECLTRWDLIEDEGKQYLRFVGKSNPLSPNATYGLFRDKSNKYYFKRS